MPYTPTVQDRTGEFLMRGITGAADSLADAMKERKQKSQKAASLRKTIGVYNPEMKDEVQTMGLADLEGYVAGIGMKAAKDKLAQEQSNKDREFNLSKIYAELQQGQLARATERDAAGQRFTETLASLASAGGQPSMDFANTLAGEPMPARDLGLADIVQAAGRSGLAMEPASLAQLIRAEQMGLRQGRPEWGGPSITTLTNPVTGEQVPVFHGGPNMASLMPDNELTPQGKQRAIDQLRARQVQLAVALKDSDMMDDGSRARLERMLEELDGRLAELTGQPVRPPAGAAGGGGGGGSKAVGRFNPETGKFERF